ncbi:hypothetical protein COOONC_03943 [Cooperia oncophora]
MYPFDRYPPYISAGAVLMSHNTVAHFYFALQFIHSMISTLEFLHICCESVHGHNEAFVFWTRSINADEWKHGNVLAAHGYSPDQLILEYNASIHSA